MRSIACVRLSAGRAWASSATARPAAGASSAASAAAEMGRIARTRTAALIAGRSFSSASALCSAATLPRRARVEAALGAAPPPPPPVATDADVRAAEERAARIARRQALAARLRGGGESVVRRSGSSSGGGSKRFYQNVQVAEDDDADPPALRILLDSRALRHPGTKAVLRLPAHKRLLAHALAVEWDQLASARQATQAHRVPLTSLVCRALDLEAEAAEAAENKSSNDRRTVLIDQLLRFLDTDSVLCWAPPVPASASSLANHDSQVRLRRAQEETAGPILAHLTTHVWPGVPLGPVLGCEDDDANGHALFPRPHPPETRAAAAAWLRGLSGWDLAGVERATLAGKSLVVAARLVTEWSASWPSPAPGTTVPFTIDDAVRATTLETAVQTAQWGEVEDTHDVEDADLRRHFGSVVLLVG